MPPSSALLLAESATSDQCRLHWWCPHAGPETLSSVISSSIWLLHMVGQHHSDVLLAAPGGESRVFLQVVRVAALRPVTLLDLPSSTAALTSSSSLVFCPLNSLLQGFGTSVKPALPATMLTYRSLWCAWESIQHPTQQTGCSSSSQFSRLFQREVQ